MREKLDTQMEEVAAVAIIGSGPYGLSLAAHLAAGGLAPRIFGPAMHLWQHGMPRGMFLKSEGFASCLSDPDGAFTLRAFCAEENLPYADIGFPVPVETFVAYGLAFQRKFVPQLDERLVDHIERATHGFSLRLDDGSRILARRVVVATGVEHFRHLPEVLSGLPPQLVSHSCELADYARFAHRRVAVIGAGASALDAAAALRRSAAEATLISRRAAIRFYGDPAQRSWRDGVRAPMTPLGPGWKKLACVKAPLVFRLLPASTRVAIVQRYLGPAPAWVLREIVEGHVPYFLSSTVTEARPVDGGITLEITAADGGRTEIKVDHVIAGTGFRPDLDRLRFLDRALRKGLARTGGAPKLSSYFEASESGLYFVGTAAAFDFGPMLRFVCGAEFAARRVASHIFAAERRNRGSRAAVPVVMAETSLLQSAYDRPTKTDERDRDPVAIS